MDVFWIRTVSQTGIYATFLLYLLWAVRRGARQWVPLVGAVLYAVVFEHFNMLRYAHVPGGYHYHPKSWLFIAGDVPLYIPLAWGFILATSRRLTDQLHLRAWARPFADALLALLIDLSLDAVAIRLGFWYWHGVRLNEGFFGVPTDNFLGWLLVSYTFSLMTRRLWDTVAAEQGDPRVRMGTQFVLVPPCAYLLYLLMEKFVHLFYRLFQATTQEQQFVIFAAVVLIFLGMVVRGRQKTPPESLSLQESTLTLHAPRHFFHIFGVLGIFCLPEETRSLSLWLLAPTVWGVEIGIVGYIHRHQKGKERTS